MLERQLTLWSILSISGLQSILLWPEYTFKVADFIQCIKIYKWRCENHQLFWIIYFLKNTQKIPFHGTWCLCTSTAEWIDFCTDNILWCVISGISILVFALPVYLFWYLQYRYIYFGRAMIRTRPIPWAKVRSILHKKYIFVMFSNEIKILWNILQFLKAVKSCRQILKFNQCIFWLVNDELALLSEA